CRRILGNEADAEDAFQTTFLVLVHKADRIRPSAMVGNWLFGVARRTALKAKGLIDRRRAKEQNVTVDAPSHDDVWTQVRRELDDELSRLPEKYRVPVVLCELEGHTIQEAASRLGWPQGTLASRLAEGRRLLARRLSAHGTMLSVATLTACLSEGAAS